MKIAQFFDAKISDYTVFIGSQGPEGVENHFWGGPYSEPEDGWKQHKHCCPTTKFVNRLSLYTILRSWAKLGWIFRGSAYCQVIWNENKVKRLRRQECTLKLHRMMGFGMWCRQMGVLSSGKHTDTTTAGERDNSRDTNQGGIRTAWLQAHDLLPLKYMHYCCFTYG